jgi:hypothetical protein
MMDRKLEEKSIHRRDAEPSRRGGAEK